MTARRSRAPCPRIREGAFHPIERFVPGIGPSARTANNLLLLTLPSLPGGPFPSALVRDAASFGWTAWSRAGTWIHCDVETWLSIIRGHPEMTDLADHVWHAASLPDYVQRDDVGFRYALRRLPGSAYFLVVVYRPSSGRDARVRTAYLTRRPSRDRAVLWTR